LRGKFKVCQNTYRAGMLFFLFRGYLRERRFYIIFNSMETEKIPNAETRAAIDEFEAMTRGEIPLPPTQSIADAIAELEKELSDYLK
jgi:hypothetical protein